MAPIIAALLLISAPADDACEAARTEYEALSLEAALEKAEAGSAHSSSCLEIKALSLMVLGRLDDARAAFAELFTRNADYVVGDRSLSPSQRQVIDDVRESVRPLSVTVKARWLVHELLRLDVQLAGGLRDASAVEYRINLLPAEAKTNGIASLVGRVATATAAIPAELDVATLTMSGRVINNANEVIQTFEQSVVLAPRPAPPPRVVQDEGGVPWFVWAGIGAALVAGGVAIAVLSQPSRPDGAGTLGSANVDQ